MPKISSKLTDFSNLNQIKPDTKEAINSLTSFKNTKEFKKRDCIQVLPPMTCHKELALNFLILSDLVIIPINSGSSSFKDLVDLKNTLNQICRPENKGVPPIKIIFNIIKNNKNTSFIFNCLKVETLDKFLSNNIILIMLFSLLVMII